MRAWLVALLCMGFALSGRAVADLKKGSWAPDIDAKDWKNTDGEAVSLFDCRGMVVVLFFWVSWHEGGESVIQLMNLVNSQFGRSQGVFLIGLTDADRKKVEEMLEKQLVFFPVGMESESYEEYEIGSFPRVVVIDPTGRVQWSGWPGNSEELIEEIRKINEETPPTRTHPEEAEKVYRFLAQAEQYLREGRYRAAFDAAGDAYERALTGDPLKMRCQYLLDLIDALGRDKLAQAAWAIDEGRFEDAVELLREVQGDFTRLDVGRRARRRLEELGVKFERVEELVTGHKDEILAGNILYRAIEALRAHQYGTAYDQLQELVSDYATTEAAGQAETIIGRMKQHPGVWGRVRDHLSEAECSLLLSQARAYMQTGQVDKARERLETVIKDHFGTKWEDEARRLLIEIRLR